MNKEDIIRMAREAGLPEIIDNANKPWAELADFAELVRADERKRFYGQDKPAECANGCPANWICDYCQIVKPVKEMIAAEREACAKVCESYLSESPHSWGGTTMAAAIRARGQA